MTLHPNAKTTPHTRLLIVQRVLDLGWAPTDAAASVGVSVRTVFRWVARFRAEGKAGLADRRSTPHRSPRKTGASRVRKIEALRRKRMAAWQIARRLGMARSTVSAVLRRLGLERLSRLEPREPARRYERENPGELIHLDTKKLGRIRGVGHRVHGDRRRRARGVGWEYVHAAVDDRSRFALAERMPDERGESAAAFLRKVVAALRRLGIQVRAVMTDNGSCYLSRAFRDACRELGIRHLRTRPYTPRTNGKVERFIQTMLREWAYRRPYRTSNQRARALPSWLRYYNTERPHTALGFQSPMSVLRRPR
ncbi:MAG TPA: IS481 family transposase [Planctomycetota bacterium]|nr:IS481 family transposase [Planctomycetota bacterium]